jgi:hypothetical protein
MLRNTIFALVAAAGLGLATAPVATAAGPGAGLAAIAGPGSVIELASFWGRPFPYGYRWRPSGCLRPVRVETPYGWHWERVWVCHH